LKNETDKGQHFYQNLLLITQESHVFITQLRLQSLHCYNLNEMLSQLAVLNKCSKSQQAEPWAWSSLHHFLFRVALTPRANKIRETKIVKYSCAKHASSNTVLKMHMHVIPTRDLNMCINSAVSVCMMFIKGFQSNHCLQQFLGPPAIQVVLDHVKRLKRWSGKPVKEGRYL